MWRRALRRFYGLLGKCGDEALTSSAESWVVAVDLSRLACFEMTVQSLTPSGERHSWLRPTRREAMLFSEHDGSNA